MRKRVMALFAVLLLLAAACSGGSEPELVADPSPTESPTGVTTDSTPTATPTATEEPTGDPTAEPTAEPTEEILNNVIFATGSVRQVTAYDEVGGAPVPTDLAMTNPTYFGNQLAFRVVDGEEGDEWVQVLLPTRPNNTLGWVNTEGFSWETNNFRVEVNVTETSVVVYEGDDVVTESLAVVGRPERPTPVVTTYIDEKISNANGAFGSAYGTWIVSLAAFSDTLEWFDGGVPKIALHGTNAPDLVGQRLSSGCVRLPNEIIDLIAENVPVGTRVDIVA
jgi:hypothetical protein